jgi:hypothetical protein
MVPSGYLRVFQPLEAFSPAEQTHWERYMVENRGPELWRPRYHDRRTSGGVGMLAPAEGEHADLRSVDGRLYVSPWRMRLRVLGAMLSFREAKPFDLWEDFVPKADARKAARELNRARRKDPRAVPFCHQSPWHVPIRWFVFFKDEDRRLEQREDGSDRLRYATTVRRGMRRAENAIPALRRSELGPISELIVDLHQWMAVFDPRSILELDYGDLSDLMTFEELDEDHSARDLHQALDALNHHEYLRSADIYQGVLGHWASIRSCELMN